MKALVGAFNQEKAIVGAFSVIVQLHWLIGYSTTLDTAQLICSWLHFVMTSAAQTRAERANFQIFGLAPLLGTDPLVSGTLCLMEPWPQIMQFSIKAHITKMCWVMKSSAERIIIKCIRGSNVWTIGSGNRDGTRHVNSVWWCFYLTILGSGAY